MATINRAQIRKELEPGLNALFGLEYNRYWNEHEEIFETEQSERAFEEEVMQAGLGPAQTKPEGTGISFDDAQNVWTARYDHETVALGFVITREAMEDGLYDSVAKRYTRALARSMYHTKQTKAAAVLNNGFDSNYTGGDGQPLFSTAHPTVSAGDQANEPSTAADLNETSLEDALIQISGWKDERGLFVNVKGQKLVVPRNLVFVAQRILHSENQPGTANNDVNAVRSMAALPDGHCVNNYLTDSDAWFIMTDAPNGMKHFQRREMDHGMEEAFDTESLKFKCSERYSFGWSDWRGAFGSPGA